MYIQVLSDENKKRQYDTFGMGGGPNMGAGQGPRGFPGGGAGGFQGMWEGGLTRRGRRLPRYPLELPVS